MTTEQELHVAMRANARDRIRLTVWLWANHDAPDRDEFELLVEEFGVLSPEMLALLLAECVTMLAEEGRL